MITARREGRREGFREADEKWQRAIAEKYVALAVKDELILNRKHSLLDVKANKEEDLNGQNQNRY